MGLDEIGVAWRKGGHLALEILKIPESVDMELKNDIQSLNML